MSHRTDEQRLRYNAAARLRDQQRRAELKAQLARIESDNITRDVRAQMEKREHAENIARNLRTQEL